MFKCSVKIDEKLQREINEKSWLINLIVLIIGSIGLGVYIIVGAFVEYAWMDILLWVFAIMFGFGLVMVISIRKINKKSAENNLTNEIELEEDCVSLSTIKNNEIIGTLKVYYKDLIKVRETENYLVLYINKQSAIPVPKKEFKPEELSTIKLWINTAKQKKTN